MNLEKITIAEKSIPEVEQAKDFGFKEKIDTDGIRDIITIGNERKGGCPFSCVGCGVHDDVFLTSEKLNRTYIQTAIDALKNKLIQNKEKVKMYGYHLCIYNQGNITNKEELSRENLAFLLKGLSNLNSPPNYISLNSRGVFINQELLNQINSLYLPFRTHFIIGVESLSNRNEAIYGKKNMVQEVENIFLILKDNNQKVGQKQPFGIDASFVFLPEFYLEENESRMDKNKIEQGFVTDISSFINRYSGEGVPIKINLHPYYKIPSLPYEDSCDSFVEFMKGVIKLISDLRRNEKKIFSEKEKTTIFIGLQDSGYEKEAWNKVFSTWSSLIDKLNAVKDYNSEECTRIIFEIRSTIELNTSS
jgi:hypothetical protein